jgi:hypothetical protein
MSYYPALLFFPKSSDNHHISHVVARNDSDEALSTGKGEIAPLAKTILIAGFRFL